MSKPTKIKPADGEVAIKHAPAPVNRMVRVRNVSNRAIHEAGAVIEPGQEGQMTPERAGDYKQRVRVVK